MSNIVLRQLMQKYNTVGNDYYLDLMRGGDWNTFIYENDYKEFTFESLSFIDIDLSGLRLDNCVFKNCKFEVMKGCSLRYCTISDCDFSNAQAERTDFRHSTIERSDFTNSQLTESKFKSTAIGQILIKDCDFSFADCRQVEFDTSFNKCKFIGTKLQKADFSGISINSSVLKNLDLREVNFNYTDFTDSVLQNLEIKVNIPKIKDFHSKIYALVRKEDEVTGFDLQQMIITTVDSRVIDELVGHYCEEFVAVTWIWAINDKLSTPIPNFLDEFEDLKVTLEKNAEREKEQNA